MQKSKHKNKVVEVSDSNQNIASSCKILHHHTKYCIIIQNIASSCKSKLRLPEIRCMFIQSAEKEYTKLCGLRWLVSYGYAHSDLCNILDKSQFLDSLQLLYPRQILGLRQKCIQPQRNFINPHDPIDPPTYPRTYAYHVNNESTQLTQFSRLVWQVKL